MQLLDGKLVSQAVRDDLRSKVAVRLQQGRKVPHLAAILIGNNGASETYVSSKVRSCEEIGFRSTLIRLPEDISEEALFFHIDQCNQDFDIDGILVQLPLPKHISEQKVIEGIFVGKDVDGFHPESVGRMVQGLPAYFPATPYGILLLLEHYKIETKGKHRDHWPKQYRRTPDQHSPEPKCLPRQLHRDGLPFPYPEHEGDLPAGRHHRRRTWQAGIPDRGHGQGRCRRHRCGHHPRARQLEKIRILHQG